MTIRCIDAGTVPYIRSQSIYHGLGYAQKINTPDTIVFARPATQYMCIGNFQDLSLEIDLTYCKENNLPVIRRQTGGGAVYVDENQLFVQWIFHPQSLPAQVDERFELFLKPLIETHKFFGIDAYYHPVNDVHVRGKKIVGTGAATIGNAEVLTGNFLFDFDIKKMTGALRLPGALFKSAVEVSLNNYLTTIRKEGSLQNEEEWQRVYLSKCREILNCDLEEGDLTEDELEEIKKMDKKLVDEQWLHGIKRNPTPLRLVKIHAGFWLGQADFQIEKGEGRILIEMEEETIRNIHIEFDFEVNRKIFKEIENDFTGVKMDERILMKKAKRLSEKYSDDELLMSVDGWVELVMRIINEKNKLSGRG